MEFKKLDNGAKGTGVRKTWIQRVIDRSKHTDRKQNNEMERK